MIPGTNQYTAQKLAVANFIKNRAGWLIWAAGFSVINSVIDMSGGDWHFMIGIGAADLLMAMGDVLAPGHVAGFILSLIPAAIFAGLGVQATKRNRWAFYTAMALYGIDAILLLAFRDFLSAAFHGYVLFRLYEGLARITDYNELEAAEARMMHYAAAPGQQPGWSTTPAPQGPNTWPPAPHPAPGGWSPQAGMPPAWSPQPGAPQAGTAQPGDWANQPGGVIPPSQTSQGPNAPEVSAPQPGLRQWPPSNP